MFAAENQERIKKILSHNPRFVLEGEISSLPQCLFIQIRTGPPWMKKALPLRKARELALELQSMNLICVACSL